MTNKDRHSVTVGPLEVAFHRTVRVSPDEVSNLPPSLGYFDVYKVADYKQTCPDYWEEDAVFLALHDEEAMWLSFSLYGSGDNRVPPPAVAVLVGAGGVNALTGDKLHLKLEKDNYLVHPPQPWLDGWKDKDGTVYQFVTTSYKKGEGLTVGEQILGAESKTGGLGIAVYESKEPDKIEPQNRPRTTWGVVGDINNLCVSSSAVNAVDTLCSFEADGGAAARGGAQKAAELGVGKGGKITQKVYEDPHGLDVWKETPAGVVVVYIVNAEMFSEITKKPMPPIPQEYKSYFGKWFGLEDKDKKDVTGTDKFTGLKTAFADSPAPQIGKADG